MAQLQQSIVRNRLLASLAPADFDLVQPHLKPATFELREHLFRAEQKIAHVTFPEHGVASIVADTEEGRFEVGMVGSEGLVGVPIVLGVDRSPHTCLVQVAGEAVRIGAEALQAAMDHSPTLRTLLLRFVHTFVVQVSQTAYANRRLLHRGAAGALAAHDA